ncbi:MAG: CehA/McbA family metallohydrolase [Verrucomicrobia bacterium]|nr:CehA/McbA family metallohydrolase [Verrucomicrobiota bacterium]
MNKFLNRIASCWALVRPETFGIANSLPTPSRRYNAARRSRNPIGWGTFLCLIAATIQFGRFTMLAHEPTRLAHEAALDPRERHTLAKVRNLAVATSTSSLAEDACQLTIRLLDNGTKKPLPGLVRITQAEGRALPLPGLVSRGTKLRNNHPAKDWFALPEASKIPVPRARLTIEAFSGLETEVTRKTVDLSGQSSAQVDVPLKSFFSAANIGWFSGNTHLHLSGLTREQADEYLRILPRADRLDLVFVSYLERAKADRDYISNGYTLADLQRLGGPGLLFGNGEEHRHNFEGFGEGYGHVMFLNIRQLVRPVSIGVGITGEGPDWPPLRRGIAQARGDGATVIWCHNTFGHEDVPDWLAGLLHAHNIFDGGAHGSYEDSFYRYLNLGLKLPFSTGTDWFIYDFSRVYARLEQALTVPNWLQALAAGRTFISNGPLLEFHAGKSQSGDTLRLSSPTNLAVFGRAKGRHNFNKLELVHNGKVVHAAASRAVDGHFEAAIDFNLEINEPSWLALRVPGGSMDSSGAVVVPPTTPVRGSGEAKNEMGEALFAHTSPTYIELGGKGIFRKEAAEELLADMESALKTIPMKAKFAEDAQREEVLKIYRDGIEMLRTRLGEN